MCHFDPRGSRCTVGRRRPLQSLASSGYTQECPGHFKSTPRREATCGVPFKSQPSSFRAFHLLARSKVIKILIEAYAQGYASIFALEPTLKTEACRRVACGLLPVASAFVNEYRYMKCVYRYSVFTFSTVCSEYRYTLCVYRYSVATY